MDERAAKTLATIKDFAALKRFETNARRLDSLTQDVADGIASRSISLGRQYLLGQLGLEATSLTPAEDRIITAVSEYIAIKKRQGRNANRTVLQLRNRGLRQSAEHAVSKRIPTQGYTTLLAANLGDLSYEQIIIDHPEEFSPRALWFANRTLGRPTEGDRPPKAPAAAKGENDQPARNPDWSRDEHILGLDLYLRLRNTNYPKKHPEVIALSNTLQALAAARGIRGAATFRNPNGVSMKMQNFLRVDPTYKGTGLPSGSKLEKAVWEEFATDLDRLALAVETIRSSISISAPSNAANTLDTGGEQDDLAALERRYIGATPKEKITVSSQIERGPVGKAVKRSVGYKCQLCAALGTTEQTFLTKKGNPYVEAHHVMPVHLRQIGSLSCTNIMIVCAHHHRQLHYGKGVEVTIAPETFSVSIEGRQVEIRRVGASI